MIFLGADHRGFELKQRLLKRLSDEGYQVTDLGNDHFDPNDDYPQFADKVAEAVLGSEENRGILLCGSGVGVDIVANKHDGIRSALVSDIATTQQSREHENVNVISLPADTLDEEDAWEIIKTFLKTPFSDESRHQRRLDQIQKIEETHD